MLHETQTDVIQQGPNTEIFWNCPHAKRGLCISYICVLPQGASISVSHIKEYQIHNYTECTPETRSNWGRAAAEVHDLQTSELGKIFQAKVHDTCIRRDF